ncbi:Uncharacterised protein [Mycobacteroides abscessus subsp. massiliense]|nr:Uncharacterised protein [Mycobacteroides abscessus subsp. massiliense]
MVGSHRGVPRGDLAVLVPTFSRQPVAVDGLFGGWEIPITRREPVSQYFWARVQTMSNVPRWPAAAGAIAKNLTHMSRTLQNRLPFDPIHVGQHHRGSVTRIVRGRSVAVRKESGTFTASPRPIRPVAPPPCRAGPAPPALSRLAGDIPSGIDSFYCAV